MLKFSLISLFFTVSQNSLAHACNHSPPLISQAQREFFDIAKTSFVASDIEPYLINPQVDVNLRDCTDADSRQATYRTALEYALTLNRQKIALRLLEAPQVHINAELETNFTPPIFYALGCGLPNKGNIKIVEAFLGRPDFNINNRMDYGFTKSILKCAIDSQFKPFFDRLVGDSRLHPFYDEKYKLDDLGYAIFKDWPYGVQKLIAHPEMNSDAASRGLYQAAALADPTILKVLLAYPGVNVNFGSKGESRWLRKVSPLIWGVTKYHRNDVALETLRVLVSTPGIDLNIVSEETLDGVAYGHTALQILKMKNGYDSKSSARIRQAIQLLEESGAK